MSSFWFLKKSISLLKFGNDYKSILVFYSNLLCRYFTPIKSCSNTNWIGKNNVFSSSLKLVLEIKDMIPDTENVPLGIAKTKALGLKNVIIETDISGGHIDFDRFPLEKYFALVKKWLTWVHDEIDENSKLFVNLRDLKDIMPTEPE